MMIEKVIMWNRYGVEAALGAKEKLIIVIKQRGLLK
jgi:hypothetical protein